LNCGQQNGYQHADNGDDDQQFDQRKRGPAFRTAIHDTNSCESGGEKIIKANHVGCIHYSLKRQKLLQLGFIGLLAVAQFEGDQLFTAVAFLFVDGHAAFRIFWGRFSIHHDVLLAVAR
jgi:hypothetical protein